MSDRYPEERSHVHEEGSDSNLSEQYQNKLAPMLAEREYDHNAAGHNTLPSILSHIPDSHPQGTSSATMYTYDVSFFAKTEPPLCLCFEVTVSYSPLMRNTAFTNRTMIFDALSPSKLLVSSTAQ